MHENKLNRPLNSYQADENCEVEREKEIVTELNILNRTNGELFDIVSRLNDRLKPAMNNFESPKAVNEQIKEPSPSSDFAKTIQIERQKIESTIQIIRETLRRLEL